MTDSTQGEIPDDPAPPAVAGERVFYRNKDEFNTAFDAAAESIRAASGPRIVENALWFGSIGLLAAVYLLDWIFDIDLQEVLGVGFDPARIGWFVLPGMMLWSHVTSRHRHGRIIRQRECLKCGRSLLPVAVDALGDGTCPKCERAFNLGEYRRPNENRGRHFHGYLDAAHFDAAIAAAAEEIRESRGAGLQTEVMGWSWAALGITYGIKVIFDWDIFEWVPGPIPIYAILLVALVLWGLILSSLSARLRPSIVERRRCMHCGYSLLHAETDDDGLGRCPECASEFVVAQYERPPEDDPEEEEEEEEEEERGQDADASVTAGAE